MTIKYLVGERSIHSCPEKVAYLVVAVEDSLSRIKIASRARTHTRVPLARSLARSKIFFCPMLKPHVPALQTRERTHALENVGGKRRKVEQCGKSFTVSAHATGTCIYATIKQTRIYHRKLLWE